jgi:hypothetical protein
VNSKHLVPAYINTACAFGISIFYLLILCRCKSPDQKVSHAAAKTTSQVKKVKSPLSNNKIQDSITTNTNQARQAICWMTVNTDFITHCLNPFLTSKRINPDCTNCEKIMFNYTFIVNGKGKIQTISKEGENMSCIRMSEKNKKKLEKEILIYMKKLVLPAPFYKTIYKGNLGFISKC